MNVHLEFFTGRNAARGFIGRGAAKPAARRISLIGPKGHQLQSQQIGEGRLKLADLRVELKQQAGLGRWIQAAAGNACAQIQGLAINGRHLVGYFNACPARARGRELAKCRIDRDKFVASH